MSRGVTRSSTLSPSRYLGEPCETIYPLSGFYYEYGLCTGLAVGKGILLPAGYDAELCVTTD